MNRLLEQMIMNIMRGASCLNLNKSTQAGGDKYLLPDKNEATFELERPRADRTKARL